MITVVGSINLDLIAAVDRLPGPGETVPGARFDSSPGGKGANQALAARRAGAEVRMVGAVGTDSFARDALALLEEAGVDLSAVCRRDASTGTALILVAADGENMIAVVAGANGTVTREDVDQGMFDAADIVLLQQEIPIATVGAVLDLARGAGARSILNTAPFLAETAALLEFADIVVANETEFDLYATALLLEGDDRPSRMRAFVARTGRVIVVTLGAQGVQVAGPDGDFAIPAMSIVPVDTVGAGDTFCGYLAAGLAEGRTIEGSIRRAVTAGALACLKPGAQPAIPTAAEVDRAGR